MDKEQEKRNFITNARCDSCGCLFIDYVPGMRGYRSAICDEFGHKYVHAWLNRPGKNKYMGLQWKDTMWCGECWKAGLEIAKRKDREEYRTQYEIIKKAKDQIKQEMNQCNDVIKYKELNELYAKKNEECFALNRKYDPKSPSSHEYYMNLAPNRGTIWDYVNSRLS